MLSSDTHGMFYPPQEIIKELRDTNDALVVRNRHLEAQIVALAAENAQLRAMVGLRPGWSFLPARAPGSAQSLSQSQAQAYTQVQPGREPAAPAGAVHLVGGQPIPPRSHALASARCAAPGTRPAAPVPPPQAASVDLRQSPGASHSSAAAGIPPQPTPGLAATALPPAAPGAARPAGGVLGKRALFSPGPLGQHIGAGKRMRQVASVLAAGLALVGLASVYPTGGPLGPPGARRTLQAGPSAPAAESKALVPFGWLDRHPGREGQSRGLQADDAGVCGWGGCVEGDEAVWMLDHDWEAADQMSRGGRGALTLARCAAPHLLSGRAVDLHALVEGRSSLPRFEHQPGEADPSRALVPLSWGESDLVDISELPCLRDCVAVTGQPSPSSLDSIQVGRGRSPLPWTPPTVPCVAAGSLAKIHHPAVLWCCFRAPPAALSACRAGMVWRR